MDAPSTGGALPAAERGLFQWFQHRGSLGCATCALENLQTDDGRPGVGMPLACHWLAIAADDAKRAKRPLNTGMH